jgi:DNA-directed RNA polymerase I subunit RPA2
VLLDGRVVGKIPIASAVSFANKLRIMKINQDQVPETLEIAVLLPATRGLYPGIYLASETSRFFRPVMHLATGKIEYIGPFEQVCFTI